MISPPILPALKTDTANGKTTLAVCSEIFNFCSAAVTIAGSVATEDSVPTLQPQFTVISRGKSSNRLPAKYNCSGIKHQHTGNSIYYNYYNVIN